MDKKLIQKGTRAEDLMEFMDEWIREEEQTAIDGLLNSSTPPEYIKMQLQAAYRIRGKLRAIINTGKLEERKEK